MTKLKPNYLLYIVNNFTIYQHLHAFNCVFLQLRILRLYIKYNNEVVTKGFKYHLHATTEHLQCHNQNQIEMLPQMYYRMYLYFW